MLITTALYAESVRGSFLDGSEVSTLIAGQTVFREYTQMVCDDYPRPAQSNAGSWGTITSMTALT